MARRSPVAVLDARAGAFKQCLGDEVTQTKPAAAGIRAAGADIGLAKTVKQSGGKARPVIAHDDLHQRAVPAADHIDARGRKADGVFDQIVQAVNDFGQAANVGRRHGFGPGQGLGGQHDFDKGVGLLRACGFFKQGGEGQAFVHHVAPIATRGKLAQYFAAALALRN